MAGHPRRYYKEVSIMTTTQFGTAAELMDAGHSVKVEQIPEISSPQRILKFDPDCTDRYVGVRAVWHAWRTGRYEILTTLSLDVNRIVKYFKQYDEQTVISGSKRLGSDKQVRALLDFLPDALAAEVLMAAIILNFMYRRIYEV